MPALARTSMPVILVGLLLAATLFGMDSLAPAFAWGWPGITPVIYARDSFATLFLAHAALVAAAGTASTLIGVGVGILVTRDRGRAFRPIVDSVAVIGQTFPPAAVLALAVPAVGFGAKPTLIALALYGLLPIVENTIAGLESVPSDVRLAARGMGLGAAQMLRRVELPLAAPSILAGVRTSVTIAIGTAAIGSTVGALTLGAPIISGLYTDHIPWAVQGAVLVGLFAVLTDMLFERLARRLTRHRPAGTARPQ